MRTHAFKYDQSLWEHIAKFEPKAGACGPDVLPKSEYEAASMKLLIPPGALLTTLLFLPCFCLVAWAAG